MTKASFDDPYFQRLLADQQEWARKVAAVTRTPPIIDATWNPPTKTGHDLDFVILDEISDWTTHERKSKKMKKPTTRELEDRVDDLESRLKAQGSLLPDEPPEGAILAFSYQFPTGGAVYSYAAIRMNSLWSTTGPRSPKQYTWAELVAWLRQGTVSRARYITSRKSQEIFKKVEGL